MSHGLVPLPNELIANMRAVAEASLNCASTLPVNDPPPAADLYKWADDIVTQLAARGDANPKLSLAEALGIPSDPRWLGSVGALRSAPRHRVIARFARERLWAQIWSLNWDCAQEAALESVGIERGDESDAVNAPWITTFKTFVTVADCAAMGAADLVKIIKPHGCVNKLVAAQEAQRQGNLVRARALADRFLITATELEDLKPTPGTQEFIFATLCDRLSAHPLVVIGWSLSEEYLLRFIEERVQPILDGQQLPADYLSIIDLAFNANGHTRVAASYKKQEETAFIKVGTSSFTTNDVMLWIQALYAIRCLDQWALIGDRPALDAIATTIDQPPDTPHFAIDWADSFLPAWVRLCWRCGLMEPLYVRGQRILPHEMSLESPDEHIPWWLEHIPRNDLVAASRLLAALQRGTGNWDLGRYPGALFRDGHLVIPLPAWSALPDALRGVTRFLDAIGQAGTGYIDRFSILPVGVDAAVTPAPGRVQALVDLVASELPVAFAADGGSILAIGLEDL